MRVLEDLRRDLILAFRQFRRSPAPMALVVVTLAAGIGANVAMVSLIDALLLRPPAGVSDPDRVVRLIHSAPNARGGQYYGTRYPYSMLVDLQRDAPAFEALAGYTTRSLSLWSRGEAVAARVSLVTPQFFSVFGMRPRLGRAFSLADGLPEGETTGGQPLVVLAFSFWARRFAGDSGVLGKTIRIGSGTYVITGVAPPGFVWGAPRAPDVWIPLSAAVALGDEPTSLSDRSASWIALVGRVRATASTVDAERQAARAWQMYSPTRGRDSAQRIVAAPLVEARGPDAPREVRLSLWLTGVSALVLLIACANVSSLLLARGLSRRREMAIRVAIGCSPVRLARQMLTEGVLVAAIGAAAASLVLVYAGGALKALVQGTQLQGPLMNVRIFVLTASIAGGTGILVSLAPVLLAIGNGLSAGLRMGACGGRTSRVRTGLLLTQAALCTLLLFGAGLFALSLQRVEALDLGIDIRHTARAWIDPGSVSISRDDRDATFQSMARAVRTVPGVTAVASVDGNPYGGGVAVAAHPPGRDQDEFWHAGVEEFPRLTAVDSGFFHAVGARSLRGRDFDSGDRRGAPLVAIVNEPLAKMLWPDVEALGQCVILPERSNLRTGDCVTVVGVVAGYWRSDILNRSALSVYVPLAQRQLHPFGGRALYIRTAVNQGVPVGAIDRALRQQMPNVPVLEVVAIRDLVDPQVRPWRVAALLFMAFGAVALIIAIAGIYGVVSFTAAQRAAEVAIRTALGAPTWHTILLISRDSLFAVCSGLLIGAAAALSLRRWIGKLVFQISPSDPGLLAVVSLLMIAVALLASWVPLMRTMRRSPAAILRIE